MHQDELQALAGQAATYAYPLYEMRRMRAATSPQRVDGAGPAPAPQRWCNVFTHARQLLAPGKSRVVTPNNDTLYTNAWLDLRSGPLVIDVPDTAGRYYVLGHDKEQLCRDFSLGVEHFDRVLHRARSRLRELVEKNHAAL